MAASTDSKPGVTDPWPLPVRLAICFWLLLGVAAGVRTLLEPHQHTIFPILANSSAHWWNDQPLYADYKPLDYYRYSPSFAVAATPFWLCGERAGGVAWTWLNLAVYAAGLWRFRRDVLPGTWTTWRESLFFIVALLGGLRGFWNAQSNALMIGLLLLAAAALARQHWWRAALWLALPVLVKVTPLAVALLFCALWPRRLTGRFVLVLAAGLLLPFLTKSPDIVLGHYAEWGHHLSSSTGERWLGFRDGWTLWVVVRHYLCGGTGELPFRDAIDAPWYRVVQLATALGVLGWSLVLQRRRCERRRLINVTLALGGAWLMVFGPASEHATYVFLAPSLAWALLETNAWPRGRWLIVGASVLILGFGWGALARSAESALLLTALPLGALLFAVWIISYSVVASRQSNGDDPRSERILRWTGSLRNVRRTQTASTGSAP
jgi:hypothetical protein